MKDYSHGRLKGQPAGQGFKRDEASKPMGGKNAGSKPAPVMPENAPKGGVR